MKIFETRNRDFKKIIEIMQHTSRPLEYHEIFDQARRMGILLGSSYQRRVRNLVKSGVLVRSGTPSRASFALHEDFRAQSMDYVQIGQIPLKDLTQAQLI